MHWPASGESMRSTRISGMSWESRFIALGTCCSTPKLTPEDKKTSQTAERFL